ncbi:MAG: hypothetical protein ACP5N1_00450 [Candidatus Woesearchaeota archaeon]
MEEQTDNSQIYDFLYRIDRRISSLEKDSMFIENEISSLDQKKIMQFKILIDDLDKSNLELVSIRNHFTQCIHAMTELSKNLKNTVSKEEMIALNNTIDEVHFEEYLMPKDLKREIRG